MTISARFAALGRIALTLIFLAVFSPIPARAEPLPGTEELTWEGDLAARLVDHVDRFLLAELDRSISRRAEHWQRDFSSADAYDRSVAPQRERLAHLLGVRDPRASEVALEVILPAGEAGRLTDSEGLESRVGAGDGFDIYAVRWPAFGQVDGEGLLLLPRGREPIANVVAIPDCEVLPEQLAGLLPGVPPASQYARRLAEAGCRVIVPLLVNRARGQFDWGPRPAPSITNRELLYRSAYELGRGLVGYEVQQVLAAVDWFERDGTMDAVGVMGWGEGGLVALYSGALDPRIRSILVSGYFDSRQTIWSEPIDRNVFGLLEQFGDAELATLIAPRRLVIEASGGPQLELAGQGGALARLVSPPIERVRAEAARAAQLVAELPDPGWIDVVAPASDPGSPGSDEALTSFLAGLGRAPEALSAAFAKHSAGTPRPLNPLQDLPLRHRRHMQQLDGHSQSVLRASAAVRQQFMQRLDDRSVPAYQESVEPYRQHFYDEVIGRFPYPLAAPRPRTRQVYETEHWKGYEVVLDVFDDVFAYGILLLPKDLQPGERRPVVVCQHGLEGRPQDTVGIQRASAYAGFAGKLAERGFITFAPQNLYIGEDRFRTLQRKSYPLKKTLFSTIVPQHQQIVNWLKSLAMVDPERIAFYGLSYGGKTAMRVPPLVTDYCLSICSADFNEWVDKNASTTNPRSYVWSGEYEIFEFDLGSTFNYAEMAALIAPRPFMVERGHFDGVADDWTVAWEFAKVRFLYAARLGLADRCEIEWFVGPHTIHGQRTYAFLHEKLQWPLPPQRTADTP